MKTIMSLLFAAGLLMFPMAVCSAQTAGDLESGVLQLSGKVVSVDAQTGQIVIEHESEEGDVMSSVISVSDVTEVYKDEEPAAIDDVKAGDGVDVFYEAGDNGEKTVLELNIR